MVSSFPISKLISVGVGEGVALGMGVAVDVDRGKGVFVGIGDRAAGVFTGSDSGLLISED
jgi:hypothetical protein